MGAVLRYWLGAVVQPASPHAAFPLGTIVVNVIGCFAMGAVVQVIEARGALDPHTRAFVLVGVLGGFTTYSSFNYETLHLAQSGSGGLAVANVALTLVTCLLAGVGGKGGARARACVWGARQRGRDCRPW